MEYLPEGSLAPDFTLATTEGTAATLSGLVSGGSIVLAFYKAACPTCQLTFPYLQRLFEGLPDRDPATVWAISQDAVEPSRAFARAHGLGFPVLVDPHPYAVSTAYEIRFVPTIYLIDGTRTVRVAECGFSKPALRAVADRLSEEIGAPRPRLFPDGDRLPEWRPGCSSVN